MEKFNEIVTRMFKIEGIQDEMTPLEIPEWDSMNYLLFIAELEKQFQLSFTMNEVVEAKTLGDIRKVVKSRGTL